MEVGLFVAAHEVTLYARQVKCCGKLYSRTGVRHDLERISWTSRDVSTRDCWRIDGVSASGELDSAVFANMAEVVPPLRTLLERKL